MRHSPRLYLVPGFLSLFSLEPYFRSSSNFRHKLNLAGRQFETVVELMHQIDGDFKKGDWGNQIGAEALVLYLLTRLCASYVRKWERPSRGRSANYRMQALHRVIDYVEKQYGDKITLGTLSKVAGISSNHLGWLFLEIFDVTPMDFLKQHRLRIARMLLLNKERKMVDIALETGFYDSAHFSKCFSKFVGISPFRYRKESTSLI